jgi:hypothetical protein
MMNQMRINLEDEIFEKAQSFRNLLPYLSGIAFPAGWVRNQPW